jgi:alkylmercury lyase
MTQDPANLDFSDSVARAAFGAILGAAHPLSPTSLAEIAATDESSVTSALRALRQAGRAEFDDKGRLLGVYGLTLKPSPHRLAMRDHDYFVWCAFDAVGIPAALGETADVASNCAFCGREVRFTVDQGTEPDLPLVISWYPRQCESIRDEFSPTINFYCDSQHYASTDQGAEAPDAFLTLKAAADLGRQNWGWAAG